MWNVVVRNGRFGARYGKISCSVTDLGTGIFEPRGLSDVAPISLASLGTPVPHGGRLPSTITVAALNPVALLQQLIDPAQMNQPRITLMSQRDELDLARAGLANELTSTQASVAQVTGVAPAVTTPAACNAVSGAPSVLPLTACANLTQTTTLTPAAWTPVAFDTARREIDTRVNDLATLRTTIDAYAFDRALEGYENELSQLEGKYNTLRQNLNLVEATLKTFTSPAATPPFAAAFPGPLTAIQKAEVVRQLRAQYAKVLEDDQINALAEQLETTLSSRPFRDRLAATAQDLNAFVNAEKLTGGASDANRTARQADAATLRASILAMRGQVAVLNGRFATMFATINNAYFTTPDLTVVTETFSVPLDTNHNGRAHCSITPSETFKPYRFDSSALPKAGAQALVLPGAPQPQASGSSDPTQMPRNTFTFEIHRYYRANIVGGFVFSNLRKQAFGVTTQERTKSDGSKESVIVAKGTDDQRPSPFYLVGLNYYFKPRDSFRLAGQNRTDWTPGVLFGVGLTDTKQFFVGPNFEPTLGIDLSLGVHWGEQEQLQLDVKPNDTVLPAGTTVPPTRKVMTPAFYVMFGFDVNLFRRFMGQLAP